MKLLKFNKLKALLLAGALSFSVFVSGCSNNESSTNIDTSSTPNQELTSDLGKKDNIDSSTTEDSKYNTEVSTESKDTTVTDNKEVPQGAVEAKVQKVVDGDTMKLKLKDTGKTVTTRLLLVDTPESVKKGVDPQPFSIEASNFAKETLKVGDTVYIEYDEGDKTDKYDRHLGYLWFYCKEDGKWEMFNEKIISKGFARVGYIYSQKRHLNRFYAAQDKAKSNGLNIWSVPGYVTDKGFDVDAYNGNKNTSSKKKNTQSNNDSDLTSNKVDDTSNVVDNTSTQSSSIVYANGGASTSNKYHSSPNAHNMKGAIEMNESEAKASGYKACKICY